MDSLAITADRSMLKAMESANILSYDPEVDIAMICIEEGHAISEEHPWGLIDRHPDDGHLMGFEIWGASKVLPTEMIEAMRATDKSHGVAA
jgi:uncharacterized protein YuzE